MVGNYNNLKIIITCWDVDGAAEYEWFACTNSRRPTDMLVLVYAVFGGTKLSTHRWTLHDVVDTIVCDSCDIIVPCRSVESPARPRRRLGPVSIRPTPRLVSFIIQRSVFVCVCVCVCDVTLRSSSRDSWRNAFVFCRIIVPPPRNFVRHRVTAVIDADFSSTVIIWDSVL